MKATHTFVYSGQDEPAYRAKSGEGCVIVRPLTADEVDTEEVGPMFHIRFADGVELDAFADELKEERA